MVVSLLVAAGPGGQMRIAATRGPDGSVPAVDCGIERAPLTTRLGLDLCRAIRTRDGARLSLAATGERLEVSVELAGGA